ncbi:unnamed protein product [Amoebophrya sp. A120]|nr:unnamed protein product [Amoebophrya sp. A120]|eukprot:GSA120T00001446001.1
MSAKRTLTSPSMTRSIVMSLQHLYFYFRKMKGMGKAANALVVSFLFVFLNTSLDRVGWYQPASAIRSAVSSSDESQHRGQRDGSLRIMRKRSRREREGDSASTAHQGALAATQGSWFWDSNTESWIWRSKRGHHHEGPQPRQKCARQRLEEFALNTSRRRPSALGRTGKAAQRFRHGAGAASLGSVAHPGNGNDPHQQQLHNCQDRAAFYMIAGPDVVSKLEPAVVSRADVAAGLRHACRGAGDDGEGVLEASIESSTTACSPGCVTEASEDFFVSDDHESAEDQDVKKKAAVPRHGRPLPRTAGDPAAATRTRPLVVLDDKPPGRGGEDTAAGRESTPTAPAAVVGDEGLLGRLPLVATLMSCHRSSFARGNGDDDFSTRPSRCSAMSSFPQGRGGNGNRNANMSVPPVVFSRPTHTLHCSLTSASAPQCANTKTPTASCKGWHSTSRGPIRPRFHRPRRGQFLWPGAKKQNEKQKQGGPKALSAFRQRASLLRACVAKAYTKTRIRLSGVKKAYLRPLCAAAVELVFSEACSYAFLEQVLGRPETYCGRFCASCLAQLLRTVFRRVYRRAIVPLLEQSREGQTESCQNVCSSSSSQQLPPPDAKVATLSSSLQLHCSAAHDRRGSCVSCENALCSTRWAKISKTDSDRATTSPMLMQRHVRHTADGAAAVVSPPPASSSEGPGSMRVPSLWNGVPLRRVSCPMRRTSGTLNRDPCCPLVAAPESSCMVRNYSSDGACAEGGLLSARPANAGAPPREKENHWSCARMPFGRPSPLALDDDVPLTGGDHASTSAVTKGPDPLDTTSTTEKRGDGSDSEAEDGSTSGTFLTPKTLPEVCSEVCCNVLLPESIAEGDSLASSILSEMASAAMESTASAMDDLVKRSHLCKVVQQAYSVDKARARLLQRLPRPFKAF